MSLAFWILLSLCVLLCLGFIFMMFVASSLKSQVNAYGKTVDKLYNDIVLNENLIDSSIKTISQAYKIEEGDLRNFIAWKQEK